VTGRERLPVHGRMQAEVTREEMDGETIPLASAHFGLTMLRAAALQDLPKPWFAHVPDEHGGYGDGRTDADVAFWRRWQEGGRTLHLANRIAIGHLELMITWPDRRFQPLYQHKSAYDAAGKPEGCWQ